MAENQNKEKDLEQPVEEKEETTEAAAEEKETSETPEAEEKESAEETPEKKSKFFKKDKKDKKDAEIEELKDRLVRQMAEFDNYRKRTDKEKKQNYEIGASDFILKILPVVDNFERGLDALSEEEKVSRREIFSRKRKRAISEVATISKLPRREALAEVALFSPSISRMGAAISSRIMPMV